MWRSSSRLCPVINTDPRADPPGPAGELQEAVNIAPFLLDYVAGVIVKSPGK